MHADIAFAQDIVLSKDASWSGIGGWRAAALVGNAVIGRSPSVGMIAIYRWMGISCYEKI